jgi:hypothetical protein
MTDMEQLEALKEMVQDLSMGVRLRDKYITRYIRRLEDENKEMARLLVEAREVIKEGISVVERSLK